MDKGIEFVQMHDLPMPIFWRAQYADYILKVIQNIKNIELFYGRRQPRLRQIFEGNDMPSEPKTLYDKIWAAHEVGSRADGNSLLYIDLQLLHEVTLAASV